MSGLHLARSIHSVPASPTTHFLKIHLNIIFPTTPGSSKWSLSLRFPHQNSAYASPLPHICYISRTSQSSRFDYPNNFGWEVQIIKNLIMCFSPLPCNRVPLRPKYSPQHPILENLNVNSSLNVSDQVSHPYKTEGKITVLYILIFIFLDSKPEDKVSAPNDSKHSVNSVCSYFLHE